MKSFMKAHKRSHSAGNREFEDSSTVPNESAPKLTPLLIPPKFSAAPTNSHSPLKKLNPISYIRRSRRNSDGYSDYVPSAEEYREAGSIFGTRRHDWGSTKPSPVFQPTAVVTPSSVFPTATADTINSLVSPISSLGSSTNDSTPASSSHSVYTDGKSTEALPLILEARPVIERSEKPEESGFSDLEKELSTIIRHSQIIESGEESVTEDLPETPALTIDKRASIVIDEDDNHSEFSFEEDIRMGRSSSVNYHTLVSNTKDKPESPLYNHDTSEEDSDLYEDDFDFENEIKEDDEHLYRSSSNLSKAVEEDTNTTPIVSVAPLHLSTTGTIKSLSSDDDIFCSPIAEDLTLDTHLDDFDEDDDDDDCYYDSLLDEVNAVPSDADEDYEPIMSSSKTRFDLGFRRAKSYSFQGQYSPKPPPLKRQTSVFKTSEFTTVTLFSPSPSLSKNSSFSSSRSSRLSNSSSSLYSVQMTPMEEDEYNYEPPMIPVRKSLTPISESR